jgi:hypothetical protein
MINYENEKIISKLPSVLSLSFGEDAKKLIIICNNSKYVSN